MVIIFFRARASVTFDERLRSHDYKITNAWLFGMLIDYLSSNWFRSRVSICTKYEAQTMVRPPGFGPGLTAWKADVLNQARLRPQSWVSIKDCSCRLKFLSNLGAYEHFWRRPKIEKGSGYFLMEVMNSSIGIAGMLMI